MLKPSGRWINIKNQYISSGMRFYSNTQGTVSSTLDNVTCHFGACLKVSACGVKIITWYIATSADFFNKFVDFDFLQNLLWNCPVCCSFCCAMLCICAAYAGMWYVSVCPSLVFMNSVKTNKHIIKIFHHRLAAPF